MSEKRCGCCRFWGEKRINICYRTCLVSFSCITGHPTHQDFGCVHWEEKEPDLREQLAEYAHEAWSGWMEHLFTRSGYSANGNAILAIEDTKRWKRQSETKYECLPESEKEFDRAEADKMIAIFEKWQQKGE